MKQSGQNLTGTFKAARDRHSSYYLHRRIKQGEHLLGVGTPYTLFGGAKRFEALKYKGFTAMNIKYIERVLGVGKAPPLSMCEHK